ncbi:type IV pilin protein [Lysobacter claricitrinus]|uniref:type IV pilin protein n=1 Tax=Lysobacter claricitrinus TaxID=3367728 RepID=UPI0038B28845
MGRLRRVPEPASDGFTLVELVLAVAVLVILATIANAAYSGVIERARVTHAMSDIAEFQMRIERYRSANGDYPDELDAVNRDGRVDPWGNPYYYTLLEGVKGHGTARKDHKLNPLNSDYDLFSAGRDGVFKTQITQKDSLDDVIRARTGSYIGLAEDY